MAIDPTTFKAYFDGAFDSRSDDFIQTRLDEAELEISEAVWGDYYETGVFYFAAHLVVSAPGAGGAAIAAAGPVSSQRIGDVSITYAVASSGSGLSTSVLNTFYGQRFDELRRRLQCGPVVANGR